MQLGGYHPGRWWGRTPHHATPLQTAQLTHDRLDTSDTRHCLEQLLDASFLQTPRRARQRQEAQVEAMEDSWQKIL